MKFAAQHADFMPTQKINSQTGPRDGVRGRGKSNFLGKFLFPLPPIYAISNSKPMGQWSEPWMWGSIQAFLKAGFVVEGRFSRHWFCDGEYVDGLQMWLLLEETL